MNQIKNVASGAIYTTSAPPVLKSGVWECGDQRFTDQHGTDYQVVQSNTTYPPLTAMAFYLAFTAAEMIAIKTSTNPMVVELYARYLMAVQTNTPIDPNLSSTAAGLTYLATATTATPAGAGILASLARVPQILAGIPQ